METENAPAADRPAPGVAAALALIAIAGGVTAALGLLQLLQRGSDPMRRVNRLLDLCYQKISNLEATLGEDAPSPANSDEG